MLTHEDIREYAARVHRGVEPTRVLESMKSEALWSFPNSPEDASRYYHRMLEMLVIELAGLKAEVVA